MIRKLDSDRHKLNYGFTIVELLIVIVIIGILAAITIVSYRGITAKANESTIKADLANAKKQIELYKADHGSYPTGLDSTTKCLTGTTGPSPDTRYCLKASSSGAYTLTGDGTTYALTLDQSTLTYHITEKDGPTLGSVTPTLPDSDWITIGSQRWAKKNLNVGTRIAGATNQTNNSTTEKYCYNNDEANCTTYGALYQWDEAMQYSTAEKAQGICPVGSHIPSDNELKTLEMSLSGMTQATADAVDWRGTDEGTKLKSGGASGLNMPLAGYRYPDGSFYGLSSYVYLWSSSESSTSAWIRYLESGYATVYRNLYTKAVGFSVRCVGN